MTADANPLRWLRVDAAKCQGHNRCVVIAPDLFRLDDLGFAQPAGDGLIAPARRHAADLAARNCPEGAVAVAAGPPS